LEDNLNKEEHEYMKMENYLALALSGEEFKKKRDRSKKIEENLIK